MFGMSALPVSRIEPKRARCRRGRADRRDPEPDGHRDDEPNEAPASRIERRRSRARPTDRSDREGPASRRQAPGWRDRPRYARKNGAAPMTGNRASTRPQEQADQPGRPVPLARQDREEDEGDGDHVGEMPRRPDLYGEPDDRPEAEDERQQDARAAPSAHLREDERHERDVDRAEQNGRIGLLEGRSKDGHRHQ